MAIWTSVANGRDLSLSKDELVVYFLLVYQVGIVTSAWGSLFIIRSIREGRFSTYLIKPFSLLHDYGSNNISEKTFKLVVSTISITGLWYFFFSTDSYHLNLDAYRVMLFLVSLIIAGMIAFITDVIIGLTTFWVYNADFVRDIYFLFRTFLTGAMIPIVFLPVFLQEWSVFMPFRYMLSFPIEILMGKATGSDLLFGLSMQFFWALILYSVYKLIYWRGTKLYQGYGA